MLSFHPLPNSATIVAKMTLKSLLLLALSTSLVEGCAKEHKYTNVFEPHKFLARRNKPSLPHLSEHESILLNSFEETAVDSWSYYYSHGLHLAGNNQSVAQWTADRWSEFGVASTVVPYNVYINYPVSHSLSLAYANGSTWTASLEEEVLEEDDTTSYPNRMPAFHGYSATGDASAEYIYVGRGQKVDFERLLDLGVELEGKIAITRYGGSFRGLKVKNAHDYGMIGCLAFTDPGDDGNMTEANGFAAYPDGPARNPTSVQRGSVRLSSIYPGDPTTPGYPSRGNDLERQDPSIVLPKIPSLPISQLDATPILAALDGHGVSGEEVNRTKWIGGLDVTYSTGPAPGAKISMSNVMRDTYSPIWNTVGIINGTSPDEVIVIGNHRDAWIVGGAADPHSGSAVMVEIAKAFGKLQKAGWKPKRTIVMCSWDAEEYGLIGSTEWVEEFLPWLSGSAVAYLNLDMAVSGSVPSLSATPQLHKLAVDSMKKIIWPYKGFNEASMFDVWNTITGGDVGVFGSGSDYTSFVHNGIPSIDTSSEVGVDDPIYHYHSNFDTYHWMSTYCDPGFKTHVSMGQYFGLVTYHLSTDKVIPFDVTNYVKQMRLYFEDLKKLAAGSDLTLDLGSIEEAMRAFKTSAKAAAKLQKKAQHGHGNELIDYVNGKLRDFERGFVSQGGLPDREFYKHLIFAPGLDTGYAPTTFPGITEPIMAGNQTQAEEFIQKTSKAIRTAAELLMP